MNKLPGTSFYTTLIYTYNLVLHHIYYFVSIIYLNNKKLIIDLHFKICIHLLFIILIFILLIKVQYCNQDTLLYFKLSSFNSFQLVIVILTINSSTLEINRFN